MKIQTQYQYRYLPTSTSIEPIITLSESGTCSHHPACSIILPFDDEQAVFTATGPFPSIFFR